MKRKLFIIVALLLLVLTSCYDIPGIPYYKLDIVDNGFAQGSNSLHIITISSEYDFDAVYYTLDNSSPSESSYWYSATALIGADLNTYYGIVISAGTTIKAIGYRGEQGSFISEITIPSCSHKWDDGEITTKPTCTTKGVRTYTCTACGQKMKISLAITDHTWNSGEIVTAPTCTTSGTKTYTCTACGETKTEAINATGHSWDSGAVTIEPRCTTAGVRTYTCSKCNGTRTETIKATGHSWNSGEVTTEPGCTTTGVRTYTCTKCNGTKTETIEATGHSWNSGEVTTEPRCTTAGVRTYTCSKCNGTRTETIEASGHSWNSGEVTTEPGCTTAGVRTYTCTACNATRTETIEATGHSWDSGAVTTEPGCTTTGVRTYTCSKCNGTKTEEILATGHSFSDDWSADENSHWHNAICEHSTERKEEGNHTWNSGEVTTAPTCANGIKTYTCIVCGHTKTESIDSVANHTWNSGEVTTAPTCVVCGVKTYTCTVCGETKAETIDATNSHSWDQGVITTPVSCVDGVKTYTCTVCGKSKTESIEATGVHYYVEYKCIGCGLWGKGPSGGYVFYDKGSYSDGWRYLEAAPEDLSYTNSSGTTVTKYPFGYYRTSSSGSNLTIGTTTAIGTGKANTEALVKAMGETTYTSSSGTTKGIYAAKACEDYSITVDGVVYDDWFLPSKSELSLMYYKLHKKGEGSFANNYYWSSSEDSVSSGAWYQNFYNGNQYGGNGTYYGSLVRPVRAF